ncbi:hypothetical protein J5N97_026332 [Dioscorea zingiberensis]|uniref:DEUBAD domain-containing protein n=1 Tax=Dioscorea zingiberensis TaxID=325984 RepID=A0A9D5H6D8_9LILI|nr:hypothetical protein J5N97_026332 [Dioscorea zingiberensis]
MGIVKVRHRGPGNGSHVQRSGNVLVKQERLVLDKDPRNDSDDDEFAEVGCELAMVGDQTCSVPYDLYDLPNLKDILSLDTWNSCLTDEERFSLAAYLPDMDQETFWLTMQDLLSGDNLFFGNPLEELFRRLKGGYYTLKVSRFREALQLLLRHKYYHYLKSYHESMSQKFADMKKTWNDHAPNGGVEERIHIWNSLKTSKPLLLVDLNAFPSDDEILCKADKTVTGIPLLKKPKYSDKEGVIRHVAPNTVNELGLNTKMKAKGVLKIKPVDVNSKQTYIVQPLPSDPLGLCRQPPKDWSDVKMYRSPELPDVVHSQQRDNFPHMSTQISKRKMRLLNDMRLHNAAEIQDTLPLRMYSNDIGRIGEHGNGENLWLTPGELGKGYDGSPAEPYSLPLENQGWRKIRPVPQTVSGAISTVSSVGSDKHHIFPISPGQSEDLKHHHIDQSNEFEMPPFHPTISGVQKEVHVFPITYKRKKPHIKLNNMESLKQPMAIANSEPMVLSGTDRLPTEKTKPIKIKVKGFSDYNVQFKQGMLNGLQRGSPST